MTALPRIEADAFGQDQVELDGVKSARRTLEILNLFEEERRPLLAAEVAAGLAAPLSSTSILLRTMVAAGFLRFERAGRRYLPSARVALLGAWLSPAMLGEGRLLRLMQALSEATGETIMLGTKNGWRMQYMHVLQATRPLRVHVRPSSFRSLLRSAGGWMLLSTAGDAEARALIRRINAEAPAGHQVPEEVALRRLATIRAEGQATSYDEVTPGAGGIAMLVPGVDGPPLAMVLAGPTARLRDEHAALLNTLRSLLT